MTLIAKPVIDRKYWILQENNQKVGNVEACDGGYQVRINNQVQQYKTIKMVEQRVHVQFEPGIKVIKSQRQRYRDWWPVSRRQAPRRDWLSGHLR